MTTKIQMRRGIATAWTTANTLLSAGEIGFETDTNKFKIGNGVLQWTALPYAKSGASTSTLTVGTVFTTSGSNIDLGAGSFTLDLPATITRNAATATKLQAAVLVNGTSFDGSAGVITGGALYSSGAWTAPTPATAVAKRIYVSPQANTPASPSVGDVWISW